MKTDTASRKTENAFQHAADCLFNEYKCIDTTLIFSQCMFCKIYIGKKGDAFCCKAFPEGIPDDIFWNKKYHGEHIDGENGYQFE